MRHTDWRRVALQLEHRTAAHGGTPATMHAHEEARGSRMRTAAAAPRRRPGLTSGGRARRPHRAARWTRAPRVRSSGGHSIQAMAQARTGARACASSGAQVPWRRTERQPRARASRHVACLRSPPA